MALRGIFLGTGTSQGVPVVACDCEVCCSSDPKDARLRSSFCVESETTRLVIDSGPDFRQQMLSARITHLDAILLTHQHKDHTGGIDDLRGFNFRQKQAMPIYARDSVLAQIKRDYAYIFDEKTYPGLPKLSLQQIDDEPFRVGDILVQPIQVWHHRLPVHGFRVGELSYITDANRIEPAEKEKIRGSKYLVINALQHKPHLSHFTLKEAVALAQELGAAQTYFTHMSHHLGTHQDLSKGLPRGVSPAYDGLSFSFE